MNIGILLIAILTAIPLAIMGVFLVLRKMSMMTDAISHTVLLGIVLTFFFVQDLSSPLLIIGATLMGLVTVYLIELLVKTKKTSEDAATGVVFPLLFALAVILINTSFSNAHLDIDAVLLGKLEYAAFDRLILFGIDMGPKALYVMLSISVIVIVFTLVLYKEIKITIFDSALAMTLGFSVTLIHYLIVTLVSLAAVAAFDAVGSILVIALMVGPAITALLFTKQFGKTIIFAVIIGVFNSIIGYMLAYNMDLSISGSIATVTLLSFLLVLFFAPSKGIVSIARRRKSQKFEFKLDAILYHIYNHQFDTNYHKDIAYDMLSVELKWSESIFIAIYDKAYKDELIGRLNNHVYLTDKGVDYVEVKQEKYLVE